MTIINFDFQFANNFAISSIYPNKKTNRKWFAKKLEDNSKKKKQDIATVSVKKTVKKYRKIITSHYSDTSSDNDIIDDQYQSDYEDYVVDYSDYDSSPFDLD
jgi:nucleoside diphosphate kinase